ncbi:MAG: hypothetical protein U5P41_13915 [Gammaproteobacteria bacterium]|nr:hypothetical protein [Gammaproteobacteria bacterium]
MKNLTVRMIFILAVLNILAACAATATRHFWEIPTPDLDYPAMIRDDPRHGTAVVYNSLFCEQDAAACGFFRAHAHAHSALVHPILPPTGYPASQIAAADCWAARNSSPEEVVAAVEYLENENREPALAIVGDASERAKNIRACAQKAGNWTGGE